ncbi:MAG: acyltransferase [Thermodesulfobacteriota bacterium]
MFKSLFYHVRGIITVSIYFFNTMFWVFPIYFFALLKWLVPLKPVRKICSFMTDWLATNWVGCNNLTQRLFCNIRWHVYGLESLKPDDWYLVVANHQTWVDILVLQKIFYRKIPFLKFFLKKELFWFPVMGQAWWALDYPFMKRYSQSYLRKNPHLKGRDLEITRKACEKFKTIPVSVINFVEGTRFTARKHRQQQSPHRNLLKPKAGGIAFTLAAMGEHLHRFVDVTIAYPDGPQSFWDYLCGKVRDIRVQVRSLPITSEMLGDYFNDEQFRMKFQQWLNILWEQKDKCIESLIKAPMPDRTVGVDELPWFLEPIPMLESVIIPKKISPA